MTRETNENKSDAERMILINATHKSIVVSLRFNSGDPEEKGIETHALIATTDLESPQNTQSMALAYGVHAAVLSRYKFIDRGINHGKIDVLNGCKRPGIVLAGGFITNQAEARLIDSGTYRDAVANAVAEGILNYRKSLPK